MSAAATIFANLPELLRCLARQVRSRRQLATLCLVNRTFNAAFTLFLVCEVKIADDAVDRLTPLAGSGHLRHVRRLSLGYSALGRRAYNEIVQQMLPKMPLLECFEWKFVLLATETLRVLHDSCPRIKSIRIEFPDGMDELFVLDDTEPSRLQLEARDIYGEPDLTIFKGLEELALDNLYAPWWRSQVVQTLQNSPTIRKLALSLSPETIFRYDGRGEIEMFHDFFDQLCDEYGATGAAPLPIQSLNLGTGIYPRRRSGIEQLVNFRDLEDVHVENRGVWSCYDLILMYDGGKENSGLVFDVFQPTQCPRLRRFTAAQYKPDVHRLLATKWDSTSARQLAISFTSIGNRYTYEPAMLLGEADSRHPSLPLHFRMLDIGFDADTTYLDDVLHDLVSGDDGALEGLVIPWHRVQTDQGVGFLHLDLIANAVAKLANLTQLRVIPNRWNREEIIGSEETQRIADILARAGPRLRYIQIQHRYLSIWRNRDGTIRLEELEDREIDDVELFSRTVWEPDMPQTHRG